MCEMKAAVQSNGNKSLSYGFQRRGLLSCGKAVRDFVSFWTKRLKTNLPRETYLGCDLKRKVTATLV